MDGFQVEPVLRGRIGGVWKDMEGKVSGGGGGI